MIGGPPLVRLFVEILNFSVVMLDLPCLCGALFLGALLTGAYSMLIFRHSNLKTSSGDTIALSPPSVIEKRVIALHMIPLLLGRGLLRLLI